MKYAHYFNSFDNKLPKNAKRVIFEDSKDVAFSRALKNC